MLQASELKDEINAVVEAIDNVFRIDGDMEESDAEQLHRRLVACVDAVNDRLQKCDALLRKGLKSEAIQEAEIAPPLLGLVDDLDAMEAWDGWADYVRQFGIPPQPPLHLEMAAELNVAYSKTQPLEKLLRQHRLLALSRTPLKDRIPTLRELSDRDADNLAWKNDLRDYETQRLRQINAEYRSAAKQGQLKPLSELAAEIEKSPWSVQPSKQLIQSIREAHQKVRAQEAVRQLESISKELNAAFSDFDIQLGHLARDRWEKFNEIAMLDSNSPLTKGVAAALQWLEEEAESERAKLAYHRALAELEQGLDAPSTLRVELERLVSAAERFDEAIPDRLARRYEERLRVLATNERRRGFLVLVTSLVAVLACGAIVAVFTFFQMRSNEVQQYEDSLKALVEADKLEESESLLAELDSGKEHIKASPGIQALIARVGRMRVDADAKRDRFSQALQEAVEVYSNQPTLEKLRRASNQLNDARASIRSESDKLELARVETNLRTVQAKLQQELDTQFAKSVEEVTARAKALSTLSSHEVDGLLEMARLLTKPSQVSPSVYSGSQIELLVKKLEDASKDLEFRKKGMEAERQLRDNIGRISEYRFALDNGQRMLGSGVRATDFKEVLVELGDFQTFLTDWENYQRRWERLDVTDGTRKTASEGLEVLSQLEKSYSDVPFQPKAQFLRPYFEAIEKRGPTGEEPIDAVLSYLDGPIFHLKYGIVKKSRERRPVYINQSPQENSNGSYAVYPLTAPYNLFPKSATPVIGPFEDLGDGEIFGAAPQTRLADSVKAYLTETDNSYELKVSKSLYYIAKDPSTNPILRGLMMLEIAEKTIEGSAVLEAEFGQFQRDLDFMRNYEDTNWFATSEAVSKDNARAAEALQKLSDVPLDLYTKKVRPAIQNIHASKDRMPEIKWVGILLRNSNGGAAKWECPTGGSTRQLPDGAVFIRYPSGKKAITVKIGEIRSRTVLLDATKVSHFKEARPVFIAITDQ